MANDNDRLRLADPDRVQELLDQLADQIKGDMNENTALIGILRRGAPLAWMLSRRLAELGLDEPEVGELKLKRYSDDLELLHEQPGASLQAHPLS